MKDSRSIKLKSALDKMPNEFTSREFSLEARKNGVSEKFIRHGGIGEYLHRYCDHPSKFQWIKRTQNTLHNVKKQDRLSDGDYDFEKECVEYLKEKGYKIFKLQEV